MEQSVTPNTIPQTSGNGQEPAAGGQVAGSEFSRAPTPELPASAEQQPQVNSTGASQPFIVPVANPPQPQPVTQVPQDDPQDDSQQDLPAEDVDVIEKEWVNRAKQIVAETREDPRAQERKVSELQSDYLKKRYGKEIGVSEK